jgi:hypothetical protein
MSPTPVETGPTTNPASCTMDTVSRFSGLNGRGVAMNTHPRPAPRLRMCTAIALLSALYLQLYVTGRTLTLTITVLQS